VKLKSSTIVNHFGTTMKSQPVQIYRLVSLNGRLSASMPSFVGKAIELGSESVKNIVRRYNLSSYLGLNLPLLDPGLDESVTYWFRRRTFCCLGVTRVSDKRGLKSSKLFEFKINSETIQ